MRFGFRSWSHNTFPCFVCDCPKAMLHSLASVTLQSGPWTLFPPNAYAAEVQRCTKVAFLDSTCLSHPFLDFSKKMSPRFCNRSVRLGSVANERLGVFHVQVIRIVTAPVFEEIKAALFFDSRKQNGGRGRCIRWSVDTGPGTPSLEKGDRLEPTPECPDVGKFLMGMRVAFFIYVGSLGSQHASGQLRCIGVATVVQT